MMLRQLRANGEKIGCLLLHGFFSQNEIKVTHSWDYLRVDIHDLTSGLCITDLFLLDISCPFSLQRNSSWLKLHVPSVSFRRLYWRIYVK